MRTYYRWRSVDEITGKELLLGIAVFIVSLALAIFISPGIKDSILAEIKLYGQAVKIENNPDLFNYGVKTSAGNMLVYDKFTGLDLQTHPNLLNKYSIIEEVTERYTQHSRQVCNSRDEEGDCTSYRTEYYYTWDTFHKAVFASNNYLFAEKEFTKEQLKLGTKHRLSLNKDTVVAEKLNKIYLNIYIYRSNWLFTSEGDLRYYYNYLPVEFNGTIACKSRENKLTGFKRESIDVYYETKPEDVVKQKEQWFIVFDFVFYICWSLVTILLYGVLAEKVLEIE